MTVPIDIATELMKLSVEMSRSGLERHVVGMQPISDAGYPQPWRDIRFQSMELARQRYDRGEVEMIQERSEDSHGHVWILQYAIPRRKRREKHLDYFCTRRAA
ncbi:MAG: hypothetical protein ACR2RE_21120 [Geminicoccaceae bacterium]